MVSCVTGFGWSGSGAVLDLIREYDDVLVVDNKGGDWEFYLLHDSDGILDLEYYTCYKHNRLGSYSAIKRFEELVNNYVKHLHYEDVFSGQFKKETDNYINSLVDFQFEASTFADSFKYTFIERAYNKIIYLLFGRCLSRMFGNFYIKLQVQRRSLLKVSYMPSDFVTKAKNYLNSLFDSINNPDSKPLVFDQMFPPDCPELFFKYFDSTKCIIVRRDPRDTYLLAKCTYSSRMPIPVNTVEEFILFYKKVIRDTKITHNPNILNIYFEDLIYEYQETKALVESFLDLKNHKKPLQLFNPSVSIHNTQLFKKYKGYEEDIKAIEMALSDSLYDFSKYPDFKHNNLTF